MFKLEINVNGAIHHRHWRNRHQDDFLQFLPRHFTREFGVRIHPEDITAYLIDEIDADLIDGVRNQNKSNSISYADGKILVKRIDESKYKVGDKILLEDYENARSKRDEKFKDSKNKDALKVKVPSSKKEDGKDIVTIEVGDFLSMDAESIELELSGQKLIKWPYKSNLKKDKKGNLIHKNGIEFLGNK